MVLPGRNTAPKLIEPRETSTLTLDHIIIPADSGVSANPYIVDRRADCRIQFRPSQELTARAPRSICCIVGILIDGFLKVLDRFLVTLLVVLGLVVTAFEIKLIGFRTCRVNMRLLKLPRCPFGMRGLF